MITDFHSHILPAVDDGSKNIEESLGMLRCMSEQGINRVIATPHFYADRDRPKNFLLRRQRALDEVLAAIDAAGGLQESPGASLLNDRFPEILLGAEVAYFHGMSESRALQDLVIEGTQAILVEMPMGRWSPAMYAELERIQRVQGLVPIVAHVDRYLGRFRDYGIPDALGELPVLVQANASFFLHRESARKALKLLERDQVHVLGSDAHNLTTRRPNLGQAVAAIEAGLGQQALERIAGWQAQILRG